MTIPHLIALASLALLITACDNSTCETSADCFKGEVCTAQGKCREPSPDMTVNADMHIPDLASMDMSMPDATPDDMSIDIPVDIPDDTPMDMPDTPMDIPDAPMDMPDTPMDMPDTPMDMPDISVDPCGGITCSGHGTCVTSAATTCDCDPGYVTAQNTACAPAPAALTIEAGGQHSCAIKAGALYCWGDNTFKQTVGGASSNTPLAISTMSSGVSHVSLGGRHSCAIKAGALYCWGDNASGQLGTGTTTTAAFPVPVNNMDRDVEAVFAGGQHTCAIKAGALYCWGDNTSGQLGIGNGTSQTSPAVIPTMSAGVTGGAAALKHTCAIKSGALYCWGDNASGQLGIGSNTSSPSPVRTLVLTQGVSAVAASDTYTCAIKADLAYCWGLNPHISLDKKDPTTTSLGTVATALSTGRGHLCAAKNSLLLCWGDNARQQIRTVACTMNNTNCFTPTTVPGLSSNLTTHISAGAQHTCVVYNDRLYCWGDNTSGQVTGNNNPGSPVQVMLP